MHLNSFLICMCSWVVQILRKKNEILIKIITVDVTSRYELVLLIMVYILRVFFLCFLDLNFSSKIKSTKNSFFKKKWYIKLNLRKGMLQQTDFQKKNLKKSKIKVIHILILFYID